MDDGGVGGGRGWVRVGAGEVCGRDGGIAVWAGRCYLCVCVKASHVGQAVAVAWLEFNLERAKLIK